ncbi:MAG: GNAT family N-acetyltransferase [Sporichthyaceae bacterium]
MSIPTLRLATPADALPLGHLLHDFNTEFDTETPGPEPLAARLRDLLAQPTTFALLADDPPVAFGLITLRTNVWFDGPVALLDEFYVRPHLRDRGIGTAMFAEICAEVRRRGGEMLEINVDSSDVDTRRFYERHGAANTDPGREDQLLYYFKEL